MLSQFLKKIFYEWFVNEVKKKVGNLTYVNDNQILKRNL